MKRFESSLKSHFYITIVLSAIFFMNTPADAVGLNNLLPSQIRSVEKSFQTNSSQPKRKRKRKTKQKINQTILIAVQPSAWGAIGIGLVVEEDSAKIEYDCAGGEIEKKLMMDKNGNFNVEGVHIPSHGGPVRIDEQPKRLPARYEGKISGNTMTLKVTLIESKKVIGEFTLERDKTPRIVRCL